MRSPGLRAAVLWTLASVTLAAQATAPPQDRPTFRADSRLVRVSVVVTDRSGRPVPGLTAADFAIEEDGTAHEVALFSVERNAESAAAPGARSFVNRHDGPDSTGVTVILYDRLNTQYEHQQRARDHIVQYLKQLRPADRVGFYVLDGDAVRVLHAFTDDSASLLRTLERTRARDSAALAASEDTLVAPAPLDDPAVDAELAAWLADQQQMIQGFAMERRVNASIGALEALGKNLAGVRGRKNVIWISGGFPIRYHDGISLQSAAPQIYRAMRALNDADIAVYPVDARGLVGAFATPANARQQQFTTLDTVMRLVETSQVIAERTGGRAFFNTNDLGGAIQRAAEDSRLTYVLGYYPAKTTWDGKFRNIKVSVRRRGVDVRHRRGYFAIPPPAPVTQNRDHALFDALNSPLDLTAIGLRVDVAPGATPTAASTLTIRLDPDAIALQPRDGEWVGVMDLAIAQALPDGRLSKSVDTRIPLTLGDEMHARLRREGLTVTHTIEVRADAHQIKVAVRDPATGAVGTLTMAASRVRGQ